jgi:hypothetical protein
MNNAELMQWIDNHQAQLVDKSEARWIPAFRLRELFKGMDLVPEALQPSGDVVSVARGDLNIVLSLAGYALPDASPATTTAWDAYSRVAALSQPSTVSDGKEG